MTGNTPDPHGDPHDAFDWDRLEAEIRPGMPDNVLYLPGARTPDAPQDAATHYEVTLDDIATPSGAVVDLPTGAGIVPGSAGRRPVIPSSLIGWPSIKATMAQAAGRAGYVAAFHAVRTPWYGAQVAWYSTIGGLRLAGRHLTWWWVSEAYSLRQAAADANDALLWMKLHREVKATRLWRAIVLCTEAVAGVLMIPLGWDLAPWWARCLTVAGAGWLLTKLGRPAGHQIVKPVVVTGRYRKLNTDIVLRAYYAAGLGRPDKPNHEVTFASTMARDAAGGGSYVAINLPYGKTYDDVVKAKGAIASGLDVAVSQVYLTRDPSSHRGHTLYVSDRDPLAIPAGRSPLLDCKPRSIWDPAPFGLDERGGRVEIALMWISVLIGAQPRKGKTFSARALALFAALDPFVHLIVADGKASPDWRKFGLIADVMVYGTHPHRDGDPVELLRETLRNLKAHIIAVNDQLSRLPVDLCPEGKLTPALARDPRYPELRVWLLVMEEFQAYYELDDKEASAEIAALLSYIMAVGPSAGVVIVSASQKPSGVGAGATVAQLFTRYRDNHAVRFALKTGNRVVSEAILGGDAYAEGYDASTLPNGPQYRGVGYLYGLTDDTPTVRTYLADHLDAEKILKAARAHRIAAGTLSGMAAGEDMAREVRDVLADARTVFRAGENGLHWSVIAVRLAESIPEHYADITADAISAQLRALHVRSVDVKTLGTVAKGARTADIDAAIGRRKTG